MVRDEGWSGAYLERPGLDRVRDHVEAGGVGVVVALDDWDDDTHEEGELLEHLKGWVSKGERASQYPSGAAGGGGR